MNVELNHSETPLSESSLDAHAVLLPAGDERADALAKIQASLGTDLDLDAILETVGFDGAIGSVARIPINGKLLLVSGVGENPDDEAWRRAGGQAVRNAPKDSSLALLAYGDENVVAAVTAGAVLGGYSFTEARKKPHEVPTISALTIHTEADRGEAFETGKVIATAVSLARDLVNRPPSDKRPPALAEQIREAVESDKVNVKIWDEAELSDGGFGGIIGVGQGSQEPPRMVELTYDPPAASHHVALIGKGITFDTGGINLKPWKGMLTMKMDMGGTAVVAGTIQACAALDVPVKITGLCAIAENMPSGTATRPSDVLVHRNGTTVEVLNTDAEGRLVMADALAYAAESDPDVIIDIATLTGAVIAALGNDVAGVMGNDEELVNQLQAASVVSGEQIWPLPLIESYNDTLKSKIADLKNIGKPGHAGTISAGLFLRHFVGDHTWAHLDIAGTAWREENDNGYRSAGGTGFGVALLVAYLQALSGTES